MADLTIIWKITKEGMAVYNLVKIILEFLKEEKRNILLDIAEIHNNSAEQSCHAAEISEHPERHLNEAILHLKDSFNAYRKFLENDKKEREKNKKYNGISSYDEYHVRKEVVEISLFITQKYIREGDTKVAKMWANKCLNEYIEFKDAYADYMAASCYDYKTVAVQKQGYYLSSPMTVHETISIFSPGQYEEKMQEYEEKRKIIQELIRKITT